MDEESKRSERLGIGAEWDGLISIPEEGAERRGFLFGGGFLWRLEGKRPRSAVSEWSSLAVELTLQPLQHARLHSRSWWYILFE